MTMRRRKTWRFVGRSGFAVACISLVLFGMNSRWDFGFARKGGIAVGADSGFAVVGIRYLGADLGWFWQRGYLTFDWFQPSFNVGVVFIPLLPVAFLGAACGFVGWILARRKLDGFCPVCSYNLTGNVSGTCPECGTTTGPETG